MGRKVHPLGFRLGYNKEWGARWYAEGKRYRDMLHEDLAIRRMVSKTLGQAAISHLEVERYPKQIRVTIHSAKPGVVIGKKGATVKELKEHLEALTGKKAWVEVQEVEKPELNAVLIAESIAEQLEKRVSHKRAMKQAATRAVRSGAKGIKIRCAGRLAGAEMARREWVKDGRIPLQTLRADIDYACREALTIMGRIGIKVWVYRGELLPESIEVREAPTPVAEEA